MNTKIKKIIIASLFLSTVNVNAGWNELVDGAIQTSKKACIWCDKSLTDLKEEFKDDVKSFDEQKTDVSSEFTETKKLIFDYASILKKSKNENIKFGKLYDKWDDTALEVKQLGTKFVLLVKSAEKYFIEIDN